MPDNDVTDAPSGASIQTSDNDLAEVPKDLPPGMPDDGPSSVLGKYLSDVQLAARYGVHRSTPWRWTKADEAFPKPVKLSSQCSRWKLSEIEAWEASRAATAQ